MLYIIKYHQIVTPTSNIHAAPVQPQASLEPVPDLGHGRLEDHREVLHDGGLQDTNH